MVTGRKVTLEGYPLLDISAQPYKALAPMGLATGADHPPLPTELFLKVLRGNDEPCMARDSETRLAKGQEKIVFCRKCEAEEIYSPDNGICSLLYQDRRYLKSTHPLPLPLML